ncbi:PAS domain-containing protein [Ascidiaceihabitans sp.]|uniref:PAS domain-containing protein n=1 Tax=Ascidiaceihabitans sp. TaxID=1872644 RepID=UPI00329879CB
MTDHRTDIGFSALNQVESYWEALRGTRMMPKRSEIDPRGIESALEYTFILERIAPGMARLRIAGSHLSDLMGMEVRGMPLTSFITPTGRRQISDTLEEVFQRPAACEVRMSAESGSGKPHMDARMLLLPLKSDLGDVSRVLGCFVAHGEVGRSPRRFDVVGAKIRPIMAPATLPQATLEEPLEVITKIQGSTDTSMPMDRPKDFKEVSYLRLIKTDD